MVANDRKGLLLLLSHWDILGKLPPNEFKNVMQAVFANAGANCEVPEELSLLEQIAYESINKDVQWSIDQYEKTKEKRAEAGRKGGLKKAENAKKQSESEPSSENVANASKGLANASKGLANSSKASNATFASSKSKQNVANVNELDLLEKNESDEEIFARAVRIAEEWEEKTRSPNRQEDNLGPSQWPIYTPGN